MQNLDTSVAQGCSLYFARMCGKQGVVVCASEASVHVNWILRTHKVAYALDEEEDVKEKLLGSMSSPVVFCSAALTASAASQRGSAQQQYHSRK
jgi:hypothetical protein